MKKLFTGTAIAAVLAGSFAATSQAASTLTEAESKTLQFMHEEEKLAKDVYLTLYDKWNIRSFSNIAGAEQRHQNQLKALLDKYGVPSAIQSSTVGDFANPELAKMYKDLTTQGLASLEGALKVGGMIEELDIMDLQKAIAESDKADVDSTYENLMRGSRNHLRAFAKQYNKNIGSVYQAQLMPAAEVSAIINSEQERGGGTGGQGHGGKGKGGGHGQGQNMSQHDGHGMQQGRGQGRGQGHRFGKGNGAGYGKQAGQGKRWGQQNRDHQT
ncbi:DUF2202 domain-containing protein [Leucothrix pacifica]|uniref:DUF2202 domain-containing protein n=1 Tax=Leucothrix pacifica TaxID=1247513 RepID=A0A317CU91_9GAMM|nr:DUF2202 domain-containing protein [Leucothrix pacifica]PWQ99892.1 hypothetical protein DKW60_04290 [Leucothrix pacifica]